MDDNATPSPDRVPDPHRNEPVPEQEEGIRPGADPAVRPSQDEEVGPLEGLLGATAADVSDEAAEMVGERDRGAEALLAQMGVEEENLASGQMMGLGIAVLASVAALAVILIYLFIIPSMGQTEERLAGEADYQELNVVRTEGMAKLNQYTNTGETYGVPIDRAMGLVVAGYGSGAAVGLPQTRQEWNLLPVMRGMGNAVQEVDRADIQPRFDDPELVEDALLDLGQEVGVESFAPETVIPIDTDDSLE